MSIILHVAAALLLLVSSALSAEPRLLGWEELLPEGEIERLEEMLAQQSDIPMFGHSPYDDMMGGVAPQMGTFNTVEELDGALVRIPGFVLPFEYSSSGKISEFLLVPYFGACIHVPPPPPNQMVYVKAEKPVDVGKIWDPIYAVGVLRAERHMNGVGNAAYTLELQSWEIYE